MNSGIRSTRSPSFGMCFLMFGCGQSVPQRIRSGATSSSACANGTASVNGGPIDEIRSAPQILTQQLSMRAAFKQHLERLLLEAVLRRHAPHVVDDERHGQRAQHLVELEQVDRVEVQHDVPIELGRARDEPLELVHVRRAAEMLHEVEADAADAARVQILEILVREGLVDVRDAAIAAAALRDRVEDHGVVDAVAARVHEHGAREPERLLQLNEPLERRVGRRVAAIRRVRIFVAGTEDVAVRVARARRRTVLRRPGVRRPAPCRPECSRIEATSPADRASPSPAAPARRSNAARGLSRIAATNSRSWSSMPFIDTSTFDRSIFLSLPSNKSS